MKLAEIFSQLTYGELSNLNLGGNKVGEIPEESYKAIANHVNMGLTALFTRFNLKEGRFKLALIDDQVTYPLLSQYAVSNVKSKELVKYIIDTVQEPFKDDIIKIEHVLTPHNIAISLNTGYHPYVCATPTSTTLRVPPVLIDGSMNLPEYLRGVKELIVIYRANHIKLDPDVGAFDPAKIEIQLPNAFLQALLYYVASRVNNPIGLGQEFNAGNTYAAKYERECQMLENKGVDIDENTYHTKLADRGFA